jgi:hypothetical protein
MRSRGFFAGAVGGLALALLLVGVVSFLPQSGGAIQGASTGGQSQPEAALATTTSACPASPAFQAPCVASQAISPTVNSTAVSGGLAASGNAAVSSSTSPSLSGNGSVPAVASVSNRATTPQRPSSLLAALPGEGIGTLLGTVSPLLIGLLVAVLVYGAYARRQDAPS